MKIKFERSIKKAGVLNKTNIFLLFLSTFCLISINGMALDNNISSNDNLSSSSANAMLPHIIWGYAVWDGGGNAVGALVEVKSSLGTLTDTVASDGAWQVDCGDPGPNWPG